MKVARIPPTCHPSTKHILTPSLVRSMEADIIPPHRQMYKDGKGEVLVVRGIPGGQKGSVELNPCGGGWDSTSPG